MAPIPCTAGKDYTFTLEITSEAYEAAALAVKVNDTLLTEADGKYTVKNVSSRSEYHRKRR